MDADKRIGWLDGVKAMAAVMVFNIHFLNAYYPGIYSLKPEHFHTVHRIEWWIGTTPLNLVYAGKLGARIFLAVSAFLLARKYFISDGKRWILLDAAKKYFRLLFPLLAVNIIICLLMGQNLFVNDAAAALAGSTEFFGSYNQFSPNMGEAVKEALWSCFMFGANRYNGPIWFIQYEFWGCVLVAAVLTLTGKWRYRYILYAVLGIVFIRTDYLGMLLSMGLADIIYTKAGLAEKLTKYKWPLWILLAGCLYFATYPSYGIADGTIYDIFPPKVLFYYNVLIPVFLFVVIHLKSLQHFFDRKLWLKFNRISYCFYLVHFPMLCILSSAFFIAMYGRINYHLLALLNYILTFTATAAVAWLLNVSVDSTGQRLIKGIEQRCAGEQK